jgi:hypothetical protein
VIARLIFPGQSLLFLACLVTAVLMAACSTSAAVEPPVNIATAEAVSSARTGDPTPYPTSTPYPTYTFYPTSTPYPAAASALTPRPVAAESVQLLVREIPADLPGYARGDWRHWIDADRDCQNTRHEVLVEESLIAPTFKAADECQVSSGQWLGLFSGTTVTEASKLDVDHMVPPSQCPQVRWLELGRRPAEGLRQSPRGQLSPNRGNRVGQPVQRG